MLIRRTSGQISRTLQGLFSFKSMFHLENDCLNTFRSEFYRNKALDKRDFGAIEFLLRKGRRQLELYSSPGITNIKG